MVGNLERASQEFAERLSKYPIEEQIAMGIISKNVLKGCNWEFIRRNPEVERHMEEFNSNPHVSVEVVTYSHDKNITGYLVGMNLQYMLEVLRREAPGLVGQNDLQHISEHRSTAIASVTKLLAGRKFRGRIGIYCTNDSTTITRDGTVYPAFSITLGELLQVCVRCGYGVVIDNIPRHPNDVMKRSKAVLKASTVAPSSNAIFFDVAPM